MASNQIPQTLEPLIVLADDAADGADQIGGTVGLLHNTESDIRGDLYALMGDPANPVLNPGKQNVWLQKKAVKVTADSNAKAYIAVLIRHLADFLGAEWNSAWEAAGFTGGSVAVLRTPDARFALLPSLRAYLAANPGYEFIRRCRRRRQGRGSIRRRARRCCGRR